MELQKSTGAFGEAIDQLRKSVDDQGKKLDRIRDTIRFAAGVVGILLSIGGFLLYAMRDSFLELIKSLP